MVNCGVCHKPIKVTRDKHYFDDKTKRRYHLDCIIDVCPTCDKPILLNQKYDRIKGQAFHPACVPSGHVHGEIMTVCKDSWKEMLDAMKAAKIPKKFQRIFEELYFEAHPPKFEEEMKENPIGLASPEDFIAWWSQGLSLGLIKADGKVVQGPSWGRFADWWTHGMTLGIIAVEPELAIEDVDNILDYIVRSFTLGLVSTGGKPSILQMRAEKMVDEGLIPSVALPTMLSAPVNARTNPAEVWVDDDLEENPNHSSDYYNRKAKKEREDIDYLWMEFENDNDPDRIKVIEGKTERLAEFEQLAEMDTEQYEQEMSRIHRRLIDTHSKDMTLMRNKLAKLERERSTGEEYHDRYLRNEISHLREAIATREKLIKMAEKRIEKKRENPFPLLVPLAMALAPTVVDTASKAVAPRQTTPTQAPAPTTGAVPAPPAGPQQPAQLPPRNNPDVPVHYIITTKEGKIYANTWGTKRQAEQTVRDIFKRVGIETTVLYPDENKREVKKFGAALRRL